MEEENELFDGLIGSIIEEKGGDRETYTSLLDIISYHETGGTMDPQQKQHRGGPGRGKYQYERPRILTSANRAKNFYRMKGQKTPEFIEDIIRNEGIDATKLSGTKQDILALADLRMGELDLKEYVDGKKTKSDVWANHWWQGAARDRDKRLKSFKSSEKRFNASYLPPIKFAGQLEGHNANTFEMGGVLNSFNVGGKHETHPTGGIPLGNTASVEQGETSMPLTSSKGQFIFTDSLIIPGLKPLPKTLLT